MPRSSSMWLGVCLGVVLWGHAEGQGSMFALVAHYDGKDIRKIDTASMAVTTLKTFTYAVTDVAISQAADWAVVVYSADHTIMKLPLTSPYTPSLIAGASQISGSTDSPAKFSSPISLSLSKDNTFALVTDSGNHIIRKVMISSGTVSTIAGAAGSTGVTDSTGASIRMNNPSGIALSSDEKFALFTEYSGNRVRMLTFTGAVTTSTTIAGDTSAAAGTRASTDGYGTSAQFNGPQGISISNDLSYALIVDRLSGKIRKITLSNSQVTTLTSTGITSGAVGVRLFGMQDKAWVTGLDHKIYSMPASAGATFTAIAGTGTASSVDSPSTVTFNAPYMFSLWKCLAGYGVTTSNDQCSTCPAGKYSDGGGFCMNCGAGTSSPASSSTCTTCTAGTYQSTTGQSACTACGTGKYSTAIGAISDVTCASCPANSGQLTGAASCTANVGYYPAHSLAVAGTYITAGTSGYSITTTNLMLFNNDPYNAMWGLSGSVAITISGAAFTVIPPSGPSFTDSGYPVVRDTSGLIVNPIAWYKFDSGGCALDSVNSAYSLTGTGSIACTADNIIRGSASAAFVRSSTQYFTIPMNTMSTAWPEVQFYNGITFTFWARLTSTCTQYTRIFQFERYTSSGGVRKVFIIDVDGSNKARFFSTDAASSYTTSNAMLTGNYNFYTWSIASGASGSWTISLNGTIVSSSTVGTACSGGMYRAVSGSTFNYYLGRDETAWSNSLLDGNIDDFRVYSGVLTATQITALYQGRLGTFTPTFSACSASGCSGTGQVSRCDLTGAALCCAAGQFFREGVDSACQSCPAGTYSATGAATACTACDFGKTNFAGSISCDVVPAPKITHGGTASQAGTAISGTSRAYYRFTALPAAGANTITFAKDTVCRVLVVGGGGGGGSRQAGGGGAGALIYSQSITLSTGVQYTVTVGAGGTYKATTGTGISGANGNAGSDSHIKYESSGTQTLFLTRGGGPGGADGQSGLNGGSGGGSCTTSGTAGTALTDNTPTGARGNSGGASSGIGLCSGIKCYGGAGGGGFGGVGTAVTVDNTNGATGGKGGDGIAIDITGAPVVYAAGGGGGCGNGAVSAGSGGSALVASSPVVAGGAGSIGKNTAGSGVANTGSGGGGSGFDTNGNGASGAGADGVVIISWGCPAGYFGTSVADCTLCSPGKYSDMGAASCTDCGGSCTSGTKRCISSTTYDCCVTGQFFVEGSSTGCQWCAGGLYSDGSATTCTSACSAGFYRPNGASVCQACGQGKYSTAIGSISDVTCASCPANSGQLTGAASCTANVGYYPAHALSGSYITASTSSYSVTAGYLMLFNNDPYNAMWGLSGSVAITISDAAFTVIPPTGPSFTDSGYPVVQDSSGVIVNPYIWYKFDSGWCSIDSSGNSYDLTASGSASCTLTNLVRGSASAQLTASSSQYFTLPPLISSHNFPVVQADSGISIAFWVLLSSAADYARIFDFAVGSSGAPRTYYYIVNKKSGTTNLEFLIYTSSGFTSWTSSGTNYNQGNWFHLVWSISNGGVWTIYIDNVKKVYPTCTPSCAFTGNLQAPTATYANYYNNVGSAGAGSYMNGNIDDFRIYKGVLSDAQVNTLYLGRLGAYTPTFSACTASGCTGTGQASRCQSDGTGVCCNAGYYFREGVDSACQSCPAGTYSITGGQTACNSCPSGMFSGAGTTSVTGCTACSSGSSCSSGTKRCYGSGSFQCCVTGQYFVEGTSTTCQSCATGTYGDGMGTACYSCDTSSWKIDAATGGTVFSDLTGYKVHSFTASGTITFTQDTVADVLVVGGGGGGGKDAGGGGGAGAVLFYEKYKFSAAFGSYSITVGAGAPAKTDTAGIGSTGSDSSIASIFVAKGGGGGRNLACAAGGNGGSGGGAGACSGSTVYIGGVVSSSTIPNGGYVYGTTGGAGYSSTATFDSWANSGGGGGATTKGGDATSSSPGSAGLGILSVTYSGSSSTLVSLFGTAYSSVAVSNVIAGGGGGGGFDYGSATISGGTGGGGAGNDCSGSCAGVAATVNTGSGGGGGGGGSSNGGAGGSGLVLIRYSLCQTCPTGSTYTGGTCVSSACNAGYYMSSSTCTLCPAGTYRASTGATALSDCSTCKACSTSGTTSGSCTTGSTSDPITCVCNAGYYGDGQLCTGCTAGKYRASTGATVVADCTDCNAGFYSASTGASLSSACVGCKTCDANAVTGGSCPAGSSSDAKTCTCNAGYYGNGQLCTGCTAGKYRASTGALAVSDCSTCKSCSTSATQVGSCAIGSTSDAITCTCNAGYYGDGQLCTGCTAGKYRASTGATAVGDCSTCKSCSTSATQAGSCAIGSTSDAITCTCNAGFFGNGQACTGCPSNSYVSSTGSTLVTQCLCNAGYTGSITVASPASPECTQCVKGTYKSTSGIVACTECTTQATTIGAGSASISSCTCNTGYSGDASTGSCGTCGTGRYVPSGLTVCTLCDYGKFTASSGLTVCQACAEGSVGDQQGLSACILCGAGKYQSQTGMTKVADCLSCDAGTYQSNTGVTLSSACTSCAAGKFSATVGAGLSSTCQDCGNGYYSIAAKSTVCTQCPPYSTTSSTTAIALSACLCQGGYYGDPSIYIPTGSVQDVNLGKSCGAQLNTACSIGTITDAFPASGGELWDANLATIRQHWSGGHAAYIYVDFGRKREIKKIKVWNGYRDSSRIAINQHKAMEGFEVWVGNTMNLNTAGSGGFTGYKVNSMEGSSDTMCYQDALHAISSSTSSYSDEFSCVATARYVSIRQPYYNVGSNANYVPTIAIADLEITGTSRIFPNGCEDCLANKYCAGGALDLSVDCPDGKYSPVGSSSVSSCVCPSHASVVSGMNCVCNDGYKKRISATDIGGWVCDACVANEYCHYGTAVTCPTFSTSLALSGAEADCKCNAGYRWNTAVTCSICEDGYYAAQGAMTCTQCTSHSNTLGVQGSTSVSQCICLAGYKKNGLLCDACIANEYCLSGVATPCPQFSTSPALSSVLGNCVCDPGYYWNAAGTTCLACPANAYCSGGQKQTCPTNTYSPGMSSKQENCKCNAGFQCTVRRKVRLTLTLSMTYAQFLSVQDSLKQRLATLAGVSPSLITLESSSATRRLLAAPQEESIEVHAYMHDSALEVMI